MEKISGIIPSNARTRSVDVSNSQPVRPGAPSYGRKEGRVTSAASLAEMPTDRVTRSATERVGEVKTPIYNNKAEISRAKVVEDLAKKFFESNPKSAVRGSDMTKSEEIVSAINSAEEFTPSSVTPE